MTTSHPRGKDEFQSAAFLALVESAQTYDPARNVSYATFARHRIWGALRDARRELLSRGSASANTGERMVISLTSAVEGRGRVMNVEPDEPVGTRLEVHEAVETWITRLPRPHSQALRLIYVDGHTQEEAAVLVGCSKSNMSRLHNQGLRWLQHGHGRRDRLQGNPEAVIDACA